MPREDRHEYEVEGCLPLLEGVAKTGWVDEDMDPTPVPNGCAECWLTGGPACITCPSPLSIVEIYDLRRTLASAR